jgi:dolichyl-phosphate-mannose-protein mannosyltransferase
MPFLPNHRAQRATPSRPRYRRYGFHALLLIVVLASSLIRFRLLTLPLERDEGEYAYAGQLLLQGIPPYQLAYAMKFPGTYLAYAGSMALFGQSPAGIHLGLLLVNAANIILVFFLAKRLFGPLAAIFAAASYGLLSTSASVLGFAAHATHFVVLPALAGTLLLLKAIESRRTGLYFASGLLLGLSMLMKQPGMFFILFGGLYLLLVEPQDPIEWSGLSRRLGAYSCGALLPFLLTCLWLWRAGVFRNFWFWTFSYASQYASSNSVLMAIPVLRMVGPSALGSSAGLWVIAALGMVLLIVSRTPRSQVTFALGFLLFSFLAVCPGFYFRQHYFILMLPAVALLAGFAVAWPAEWLSRRKMGWLAAAPALVFLGVCAYSIADQRDFLFQMDAETACRSIYAPNPFPEALRIAAYIQSHTPPDARIAVLGSEPEIYFYCHRHSATGFIYTYELMEEQKFASTMQRQMIGEIETAKPEFLVLVNVSYSWFVRPRSDTTIFEWAQKYIEENYELVGLADIGRGRTEYRWDEDARAHPQASANNVEVFRRRGT